MHLSDPKDLRAKHAGGQTPDEALSLEISKRLTNNQLACTIAFEIAGQMGVSPREIGKTADLMNVRLTTCQLGLFGYTPNKKIVTPLLKIDPGLEAALKTTQSKGRISCREVWELASRLNVSKMTVSSACEAMGIKIKPCQLGAF